jgi:hypothetical protein
MPVWEVNQCENVEAKEKRLRKAFGTIPANVKLVSADFDRDEPWRNVADNLTNVVDQTRLSKENPANKKSRGC